MDPVGVRFSIGIGGGLVTYHRLVVGGYVDQLAANVGSCPASASSKGFSAIESSIDRWSSVEGGLAVTKQQQEDPRHPLFKGLAKVLGQKSVENGVDTAEGRNKIGENTSQD